MADRVVLEPQQVPPVSAADMRAFAPKVRPARAGSKAFKAAQEAEQKRIRARLAAHLARKDP